jgi:hypothetical protein
MFKKYKIAVAAAMTLTQGEIVLLADPPLACMVNVNMQNNSRQIVGPVNTECPNCPTDPICHTAPWGNWGVASPYGNKIDGHQFDGWHFTGQWYEWNSCTSQYYGPGWMNANNYTSQASTTGENNYGGVTLIFRYGCPYDTNGDGVCDQGGCKSLTSVSLSAGYMTLYELDSWDQDDFVQTLYFPGNLTVGLSCQPGYCYAPVYSSWVSPSSYSPSYPVMATAQIAAKVVMADFNDNGVPCTSCIY